MTEAPSPSLEQIAARIAELKKEKGSGESSDAILARSKRAQGVANKLDRRTPLPTSVADAEDAEKGIT